MKARIKWDHGLAVMGDTVVGTIEMVRSDEWQAYGCQSDLNDIDLGCWRSESKARQVVVDWVRTYEASQD